MTAFCKKQSPHGSGSVLRDYLVNLGRAQEDYDTNIHRRWTFDFLHAGFPNHKKVQVKMKGTSSPMHWNISFFFSDFVSSLKWSVSLIEPYCSVKRSSALNQLRLMIKTRFQPPPRSSQWPQQLKTEVPSLGTTRIPLRTHQSLYGRLRLGQLLRSFVKLFLSNTQLQAVKQKRETTNDSVTVCQLIRDIRVHWQTQNKHAVIEQDTHLIVIIGGVHLRWLRCVTCHQCQRGTEMCHAKLES